MRHLVILSMVMLLVACGSPKATSEKFTCGPLVVPSEADGGQPADSGPNPGRCRPLCVDFILDRGLVSCRCYNCGVGEDPSCSVACTPNDCTLYDDTGLDTGKPCQ